MRPLTQRQTQILTFIKDSIALRGIPPTIAEITTALRVTSTNTVREQLRALARKGAIEIIPSVSRGIRVIEDKGRRGLPIVGRVAAGRPILAQEHIEGYHRLDARIFKPRADYLLRVHGMSMQGLGILDGDLLAVHRTPEARSGQIVVVRLDDEATVKRLRIRGHTAYLEPANPDFSPIKVDLRRTTLAVEGIGVGVLRKL
ncbi:MAG: transcriptional repressor LexA [Pseudomonadota bacterium]|jgi:repressor LexA|nr:transcriptional repressor LexA [Pseudomonadota bacterium]